ncbi:MAG: hypothetical protein U0X20_11975 [Caldilineaceae bacterium]
MTATHDLRRVFATHLHVHAGEGASSEVAADMIRRQLGHKHYSMTAEYSLLDVEDIREVIISPLSMIEERRRAKTTE